ncbi:hypothetical protein NS263_01650 [Curtobacterium oceanosedimentum]|uniref:Uncharacterized protein n=2 Tax=Curtobacterium oceanosedimentum TaxID=465820 RepID=A0ABR5S9S1_9MICO|nr:hypothetical protein NS263_01650 [Curtobacterium oceanosedimentum]
MTNMKVLTATATAALVTGAVLVPAVSAAAQPAPTTPAMERASTTTTDSAPHDETRAAAGVAKALYAGFKAATSPRDAAKVLSWASVLGRSSVPGGSTADLEASYFDR